jgi:hypothetical protein
LPYFESEGFEDGNRQYHKSGTDESDADGFFVTFVHTTAKVRNKTDIRHISMPFIPEIWRNPQLCVPLQHQTCNNRNENEEVIMRIAYPLCRMADNSGSGCEQIQGTQRFRVPVDGGIPGCQQVSEGRHTLYGYGG